MTWELFFTKEAQAKLDELSADPAKDSIYKQVKKALGNLQRNPRHRSLQTHKYSSIAGPSGQDVFEAYAQNRAPGAYRIFFFYGPDRRENGRRVAVISILTIMPHP